MRKTVGLILSICLLLALFATAVYAEEETPPIEYGVNTTFTLSIPDKITPTTEDEEKNVYGITLSDVKIPYGTELRVQTTYNNELKLSESTSVILDYSLWIDEDTDWQIESGDMIIKVPSDITEEKTVDFYGIVETNPIYSGDYTGTITFQVKIEDVVTDYTSDEIDEDDHLIGIGKTTANSVVAAFNEDYTSVVVTKNGEDSDGLMYNWSSSEYETDNPFYEHKDTLRTVDIKNGVAGIGDRAFKNCDKLTQELILPNTVESVGVGAFENCDNIVSLNLENGVKEIKKNAFRGCNKLSGTLNLGGTTEFIGNFAFANLPKVKTLKFGDNVGFIGTGAFQNDSGITNTIEFPDSLYVIGDYAFSELTSAGNTEINLPDNIKQIGGTSYSKPLTGFDTINTDSRLGATTTADYNATAFEEGDEGYSEQGYTIDNYKTAKYASTGSGVFNNFGKEEYNWIVNDTNTLFKAINGVLYSKSGKRLIDCNNRNTLEIPEGVEIIDEQSLVNVILLTLPDTYEIKTYPDAPVTQRSYKNTLTAALGDNNPVVKIIVKSTNENYTVDNNSLYSSDGLTCYHLWLDENGVGTIKDGCEVCEGILSPIDWYKTQSFTTYSIVIPDSVTFITNYDSISNKDVGDIAIMNALVDNTAKPLTINISPENTAYETDEDGHIVEKSEDPDEEEEPEEENKE